MECPHCQSSDNFKYGVRVGRQRYRCRACAKVFTDNRPRTFGAHGRCCVATLLDTRR